MKRGYNTIYCHGYGHNEQNGVQECRRNINISAIHPLFVHCAYTLWTEIVLCSQLTIIVLVSIDLGTKRRFWKIYAGQIAQNVLDAVLRRKKRFS